MAKLHELVSVREDVSGVAKSRIDESSKVFSSKGNLFVGELKNIKALDESRAQEFDNETHTIVTTTVPERLKFTFEAITKDLNVNASIDKSNGIATADLIIDGVVLLKDVPSVTLLMLEQRAKQWALLIDQVPTRPPGLTWKPRADLSPPGIFEAEQKTITNSNEKKMVPVVLYPHSDKHPAQVKEVTNEIPVAKITRTMFNGGLSSHEKAVLRARVEAFGQAAKQARMRANSIEAVLMEIGEPVAEFILNGTRPAAA